MRTCEGDSAVDEGLAAAQGVVEELFDWHREVQAASKHWDDLHADQVWSCPIAAVE